jgi:hypothetical protein
MIILDLGPLGSLKKLLLVKKRVESSGSSWLVDGSAKMKMMVKL